MLTCSGGVDVPHVDAARAVARGQAPGRGGAPCQCVALGAVPRKGAHRAVAARHGRRGAAALVRVQQAQLRPHVVQAHAPVLAPRRHDVRLLRHDAHAVDGAARVRDALHLEVRLAAVLVVIVG